jgi:hypothetical protein
MTFSPSTVVGFLRHRLVITSSSRGLFQLSLSHDNVAGTVETGLICAALLQSQHVTRVYSPVTHSPREIAPNCEQTSSKQPWYFGAAIQSRVSIIMPVGAQCRKLRGRAAVTTIINPRIDIRRFRPAVG